MAFTERLATRTYVSGSAIAQFTFVSLASDGQVDNLLTRVPMVWLCKPLLVLVKP